MKLLLINKNIKSLSAYYSLLCKDIDKKVLATILGFIMSVLLIVFYVALETHGSVEAKDMLILVFVCVAPMLFAPLYWTWHYYSGRNKWIEFLDDHFIYNNKKVYYTSVKFLLKQRHSNFSIAFYGFPYSCLLIGYSDDIIQEIENVINRVNKVVVRSK